MDYKDNRAPAIKTQQANNANIRRPSRMSDASVDRSPNNASSRVKKQQGVKDQAKAEADTKLKEEFEKMREAFEVKKVAEDKKIQEERDRVREDRKNLLDMMNNYEYDMHDRKRAKAADELAWFEFETRMRQIIRSMLEPAVHMQAEEREALFELEMKHSRYDLRLDMLDRAVFKTKQGEGKNVFSELDDRLTDTRQYMSDNIMELKDKNSELRSELEHKLSIQNNKVYEVIQMKKNLDESINEIKQMKEYNRKFISDINVIISEVRQHSMDELKRQQTQVSFLRQKLEDQGNTLRVTQDQGNDTLKIFKTARNTVEKHGCKLLEIKDSMIEKEEYQKFQRDQLGLGKLLKKQVDECRDQQTSLESWVEKYLPLKLHYQSSELLEEFIDDEQKARFNQIHILMANNLRKNILEDQGNSRLKQKSLDFITSLRLHEKLLNDSKTEERSQAHMGRAAGINKVSELTSEKHLLEQEVDDYSFDANQARKDQLSTQKRVNLNKTQVQLSTKSLQENLPQPRSIMKLSSPGDTTPDLTESNYQSKLSILIDQTPPLKGKVTFKPEENDPQFTMDAIKIRMQDSHSSSPEHGPPLQHSAKAKITSTMSDKEMSDLNEEELINGENFHLKKQIMTEIYSTRTKLELQIALTKEEMQQDCKLMFRDYETKIGGLLSENQASLTEIRIETDNFQRSIKRGQGDILAIQKNMTETMQKLNKDYLKQDGEQHKFKFVQELLIDANFQLERLIQSHLNNAYSSHTARNNLSISTEVHLPSTENKLAQTQQMDQERHLLQKAYDKLRRATLNQHGLNRNMSSQQQVYASRNVSKLSCTEFLQKNESIQPARKETSPELAAIQSEPNFQDINNMNVTFSLDDSEDTQRIGLYSLSQKEEQALQKAALRLKRQSKNGGAFRATQTQLSTNKLNESPRAQVTPIKNKEARGRYISGQAFTTHKQEISSKRGCSFEPLKTVQNMTMQVQSQDHIRFRVGGGFLAATPKAPSFNILGITKETVARKTVLDLNMNETMRSVVKPSKLLSYSSNIEIPKMKSSILITPNEVQSQQESELKSPMNFTETDMGLNETKPFGLPMLGRHQSRESVQRISQAKMRH